MKDEYPVEFSLTFNLGADARASGRHIIFPTAPFYLDAKTYNQKCKVEFVSLASDANVSANEVTIYIEFRGVKSNQWRLNRTKDAANVLVSQEFVQTPLTCIFDTHAGGTNINSGNLSIGSSNFVICDNFWGTQAEIGLKQTIGSGLGTDVNFADVPAGVANITLLMRVTPFSMEKGCH